jgi:hypothetical protein
MIFACDINVGELVIYLLSIGWPFAAGVALVGVPVLAIWLAGRGERGRDRATNSIDW